MERLRHFLTWDEIAGLTGHHAPGPARGTLVSIDIDVLVEIGDLPAGSMAHVCAVCPDAEEWWDEEESRAEWEDQYRRLRRHGEPAALMGFRPGAVEELAALIHRHVELPAAGWLANSHSWGAWAAADTARRVGGPVDVISIDQHHDLGYIDGDEDIASSRTRMAQKATCDNWLAGALQRGVVASATLVHQNEMGDATMFPPTLEDHILRERVTHEAFGTWSPKRVRADGLLLVRSSGWTPPWGGHDQAFLDLAAALAPRWRCLDCEPPGGDRVGAFDACRPRPEIS